MGRFLLLMLVLAGCGAEAVSSIPPVDLSEHSVPLDDIVFDTFDGGSVPLSEATTETIERLLDAIPPIDDPGYEPAVDAAWLADDDVVLGYVDDDGDAWAYPVKILNFHEIVNDELAGRAVLVSYCPLCGSGIVYDRRVGNDELSFSNTSALHENDMVMVDRESGSYWWQVSGRGIVGPRTDEKLTPLASEMARWSDWRSDHPESLVILRPSGRDYSSDPFVGYADRVNSGQTPFPVSDEALFDPRLAPGATVVAAEIAGELWAWDVTEPRVVATTIGGIDLEIVVDGVGGVISEVDTGHTRPSRTLLWFALVAAEPAVMLAPD